MSERESISTPGTGPADERRSADGFAAIVELGVVLAVSDIDRSLEFYCHYLGFEVASEEDPSGDERRIVTIRYGNALIDLVTETRSERRQNHRLLWTVEKLNEAVEHLVAGGGRIVRQMEYGVYCADPDGNSILVKVKELDPDQAQELFF